MISFSIFILTGLLGNILIRNSLGNTAYAVSTPFMLPLQIIAALVSVSVFTVRDDEKNFADITEEAEEEYVSNVTDVIDTDKIDMSEYPEFSKDISADNSESPVVRPDIKSIIAEQKSEILIHEDTDSHTEDDEFLRSFVSPVTHTADSSSVYDNIPTELPEDYIPYEEDEEDEPDEEYEDEEQYKQRIPPIFIRIVASVICAIIAIILPFNTCTVYYPNKVTMRSPFSVKEYAIEDANAYTVGVKLNGDVSLKARFGDGKECELVISENTIRSDSFDSSYSSPYEYAAFCDRLMKQKGIQKNIDDLKSLIPSPALSDEDLAYIEQIMESKLNKDNY